MEEKKTSLQPAQATTRLLLALWDLGGTENTVKKGELNDRLGKNKNNAEDYNQAYQQLEKDGAIAIVTTKRKIENVSLTEKGLQKLSEVLNSPEFEFTAQVGAKTVNAILKWVRYTKIAVDGASATVEKAEKDIIASYDEFQQVVLDVYDKLNRDYNLNDLVPIYRIRREVGERVSRSDFNDWLLQMQEKDILQLQGGSLPDSDPAKIEDSITTEVSGLRCYAKRLIS